MVRRPDGDNDSAEAWQTVKTAEATTAVAVMLVSDIAAMQAATQSAANGGPVGNGNSAAIAMQ